MKKFKYSDTIYYIEDDIVPAVLQNILHNDERFGGISRITMMQFATYVIDVNSNKLLKCRYSLEEVLDNSLGTV